MKLIDESVATRTDRSKTKFVLTAIVAGCFGAIIGANYRGAGEIDSDPEIPQIQTIIFGALAGVVIWAIARKSYPAVTENFGKFKGAMLIGAVCGPVFFLLVQAFHWNETRLIVGMVNGLVFGGLIGILIYSIGFLATLKTGR
jgi:drug/metabolite transporter (DMT)-like permease